MVVAAWIAPPSLALFLVGAGIVGVGSGLLYRATLAVVVSTAGPDARAGALATYFVVGYVGISLPVVGAGIALQHVDLKAILLAFSVVIAAGVLLATPALRKLPPAMRSPL